MAAAREASDELHEWVVSNANLLTKQASVHGVSLYSRLVTFVSELWEKAGPQLHAYGTKVQV